MLFNELIQGLQKRFFDFLVSRRLIYNTSWEDPRIDRQLLELGPGARIVMLTGAGCNAFDYLLDNPASIHCVDVNPAQNALLEFKKALFHTNHTTLWQFMGKGFHPGALRVYHQDIKPTISDTAQRFWNQHINYFVRTPNEPSFYYRGTAGKIARMMRNRIKRKGLYKYVIRLLKSKSLAEQKRHFNAVEQELWNAFYRWLLNQNVTLTMLGIPPDQHRLIVNNNQDGLLSHVRYSFHHVFKKLPIHDNYFWRVYLTGRYSKDCCPNYIKATNYDQLKDEANRITHHTCYLSEFLKNHPGTYTHYVLLDHQDWLAFSYPDILKEEWKLILKNSKPGTRILFRSAGTDPSFLPSFVEESVNFDEKRNHVKMLHQQDRVGTYGSTHLGIVR